MEVKKYVKLPVEIEAVKFTDENKDMVKNWITCNYSADFDDAGNPILRIQTLEGVMTVNIGAWIIKGIAGEFYPCKDEIFKATYKESEEQEMKRDIEGFKRELTSLINKYCIENESDTPDFILANYMYACLVAFEKGINKRNKWYGRSDKLPLVVESED